jgi:hypothetical protein
MTLAAVNPLSVGGVWVLLHAVKFFVATDTIQICMYALRETFRVDVQSDHAALSFDSQPLRCVALQTVVVLLSDRWT